MMLSCRRRPSPTKMYLCCAMGVAIVILLDSTLSLWPPSPKRVASAFVVTRSMSNPLPRTCHGTSFIKSSSSSSSDRQSPSSITVMKTTIRVCQNKHCRKRAQQRDIVQSLHNLLGLPSATNSIINIEPSGCLSRCDEGPNVEVETEVVEDNNAQFNKKICSKVLLNGMKDAQSCATQFTLLSTATRSDGDSTKDDDDSTRNGRNRNSRDINSTRLFTHLKPNKVLIAASKVIEQTECTIRQNDEKIRYLTSIIDTLDAKTAVQTSIRSKNINTSSPGDVSPQVRKQQQQQQAEYYYDYTLSAVYAHAYALRSQIFVEMRQLDDAIKDAQHVVIETADRHTQKHQQHAHSSSSSFTTPLSTTLAYRSWVDAEYLMVMQQQEDNVGTKNTMLSQQTVSGGFSTIFQQQQQLRRLLLRPNIDTSRVRSILQRWMADQPSYRLKIEQELKNLP